MLKNSPFLLLLFFLGCQHGPYAKREHFRQILIPRPEHRALTHPRCTEYKGDDCQAWEVDEYPLVTPEQRQAFLDMGFICVVGGIYYTACDDRNALCRYYDFKRPILGIIGKKKGQIKRVPIEESYDFLLQSGTFCYSRRAYEIQRQRH